VFIGLIKNKYPNSYSYLFGRREVDHIEGVFTSVTSHGRFYIKGSSKRPIMNFIYHSKTLSENFIIEDSDNNLTFKGFPEDAARAETLVNDPGCDVSNLLQQNTVWLNLVLRHDYPQCRHMYDIECMVSSQL
jgi:hypothetical protein